MRLVLIFAMAALLAGCASNEYSKVPEPSGEWVAANPASLMAPPAPALMPLPVGRVGGSQAVRAAWASRTVQQ